MQKQAPSVGRIFVMVVFALSCFGILLYLWLVFGGSTPLKPQGYRFKVNFPEATQLAQEADVRISGVPVGRVKKKELDEETTSVEIELQSRYAPLPADSRAVLRQKTLLGETFVELSPGTKDGDTVPDGGVLGRGQISPTVELDEIFRAFDQKTREAFRVWMDQQGLAFDGRGEDINDALGNLAPFANDARAVLEILDRQERATQQLVRDTGEVFAALTERQGQLQSLIVNSNRLFETTASRDAELAETFRLFPTFLDESRLTVERTTEFANATDPLVSQLRPAARELSPTLISLADLAPDLKAFFRDLDPLIDVSRRGLPALESFLDETTPLLAQIDPVPARGQPDPHLLGPLQERDHGVLRQRRGGDAGHRVPDRLGQAGALPPYLEPDQPGEPGRVSVPAVDEPLEPVHRAARVQEAEDRARGVRRLPVHRERGHPAHAARLAAASPGAARPGEGVHVRRPGERRRRTALQATDAARPAHDQDARQLSPRRSCA